jgi:hypothetical protein
VLPGVTIAGTGTSHDSSAASSGHASH